MGKPNFEILEEVAVLATRGNGVQVKVNRMTWHGNKPVIDIRNWDGEIAKTGVSLSPEMAKALRDVLNGMDLDA